jgi:hypothetical protein
MEAVGHFEILESTKLSAAVLELLVAVGIHLLCACFRVVVSVLLFGLHDANTARYREKETLPTLSTP